MLDVVFSHSYYYKFDAKQWKNQTPYPPLGTLYAASYLRENGYKVGVFDANLLDDPKTIKPYLETQKPSVFVLYDDGFNYLTKMCLTTMREAAFEMIKIAKNLHCHVIVCSSDSTDHYEKYLGAGADFVIQGEGEISLKELVDALSNNEDTSQIKGLVFEKDGEFVKNEIEEIDKLTEQWLSIERQTQKLENEWRETEPVLRQRIQLLTDERAQLQTIINENQSTSNDVEAQREMLLSQQSKLETQQNELEHTLAGVITQVDNLYALLPDLLRETWDKEQAALNEAEFGWSRTISTCTGILRILEQ